MSRLGALAVVAIATSGCATWRSAPAGFSRPTLPPEFTLPGRDLGVRVAASVTVRSPHFGGRFRALVAANSGPRPQVRLQLYPDVGGKILDLSATAKHIVGFTTDGSQQLQVLSPASLPRTFLGFVALTLLDRYYQPPTPPELRVRRDRAGNVVAILRPSTWPGHRVEEDQPFTERVHHYRSVRWTERIEGRHLVITAPDFTLTVELKEVDYSEPLPSALFDLELPGAGS